MKPSVEQCMAAIVQMRAMIAFFPSEDDEIGTTVLLDALYGMVTTKASLDWLCFHACRFIPKWKGFAELRALYCSRFKPDDGLPEIESEIPGFRSSDGEAAYHARESIATARRIASWKQEYKQLTGTVEPPPVLRAPEPRPAASLWTRAEIRDDENKLSQAPRRPQLSAEDRTRRLADLEAAVSARAGRELTPQERFGGHVRNAPGLAVEPDKNSDARNVVN